MTEKMQIDRMELARQILNADEEPFVLLYTLDLALFNGENFDYSATVDRRAKDLLVDVITGNANVSS